MADTLYPSGAGLLEAAGQQASGIAGDRERDADRTVQAGADAGRGLDQQKLAMLNDKLDRQNNTIQITPQLAMGLVKNTGDKSWLSAIGTKMRADVYTGLYTSGIMQKFIDKEYKVQNGDKVDTYLHKFNPDTNEWGLEKIGEGEKFSPVAKGDDTPKAKADREARERIAKDKASGHGPGSKEAPEDREFLKTYRTYQKETEGINYMMLDQMAKKDEKQSKDLRGKLDFVEKNKERFNKLQGVHSSESSTVDENKIKEYLTSIGAKDTPKNREWAKTKLTNG